MNKTELIDSIASDAGVSKPEAKKALESFLENVKQTLKEGNRVSLVGFGSWSVSERSAREGRNPRTGATIKIPAKNVVKFKVSTLLQRELAQIFQQFLNKEEILGVLISVTKVYISADFSIAKVYISIYPFEQSNAVLLKIRDKSFFIKNSLVHKLKRNFRKIPELYYFLDDSLDYIENIEDALKNKDSIDKLYNSKKNK